MKITIKNEFTKNRNCSKKRKNVSYHFLENTNIYVVLREHYGKKKDNNPSCTDIFFFASCYLTVGLEFLVGENPLNVVL